MSTQTDVLDALDAINPGIMEPGVMEKFLKELPDKALQLGIRVLLAIVFFAIGLELIKIIRKIVKKSLTKTGADKGLIQFLDSFIKAALLIVLIFMIAEGFGVDATSIVALLGSAGVAIGLAIQGSLSNFAGGVLILLLKPFKVGDYIVEDSKGNQGTVEQISLFYTRLLTMDGQSVVLPNGTLANTSLTNIHTNESRRMEVKVGITYEADLRRAKKVLQQLLEQEKKTIADKERFVYVEELGDNAVILVMRCWFLNEDYWEGKWRMTEQAKLTLDEEGIAMAYPQLDVHLKSDDRDKK